MILKPNRGNNTPDLCFTNNIDLIYNIKEIPMALSDHNIVELTM